MTEGAPGGTERRGNALRRHPFLWGGAAVLLVLAAILLLAGPLPGVGWPPTLYLSGADAAKSAWNLSASPGGPPLPLDWSSSTSSFSMTGAKFETFELSLDLYRPADGPFREFLVRLGPWRESRRTYATKGESVEMDGKRWYVLRPE